MLQASDRESRRAALGWAAPALGAGALGGLVKAAYLMAASWVLGAGLWTPANLAGATFVPFRPPVGAFAGVASVTGLALHVVTGAVWGLLFGAIAVARPGLLRSMPRAVASGLALGLVFAAVAFLTGPFFNPYSPGINALLGFLPPFVGNLIFGVVTALALRAWLGRGRMTIVMAPEQPVGAEDVTLR